MYRSHFAFVIATLLLAACASGEHGDLEHFVARSGEGLRGRVEPVPAIASPQPMTYAATELPDPFSPPRAKPVSATRTADSAWHPPEQREALESYPLDALKMVGTMERHGRRWALISTPDNTVHRVTVGNRLGQNFGVIATVSEAAVGLREHVEDAGGWSERSANLLLHDAESRG